MTASTQFVLVMRNDKRYTSPKKRMILGINKLNGKMHLGEMLPSATFNLSKAVADAVAPSKFAVPADRQVKKTAGCVQLDTMCTYCPFKMDCYKDEGGLTVYASRTARSSSSAPRRKPPKSRRSPKRGFRKLTKGQRRSKYEEEVIKDLEARGYKEGKDWTYEGEKIPYIIEAKYVPDIVCKSTRIVLKGYLPYTDRRKLECVVRSNPEIKLHIL